MRCSIEPPVMPDTGGHRLAWSPAALPPPCHPLGTPALGLQGASLGVVALDGQMELQTDPAVGHTPAGGLRGPCAKAGCVKAGCAKAGCVKVVCVNGVCENAMCVKVVCVNATCVNVLCANAMCENAMCVNMVCVNVVCVNVACV